MFAFVPFHLSPNADKAKQCEFWVNQPRKWNHQTKTNKMKLMQRRREKNETAEMRLFDSPMEKWPFHILILASIILCLLRNQHEMWMFICVSATFRLCVFFSLLFLRPFLEEQNLICESYCYYCSFVFVIYFCVFIHAQFWLLLDFFFRSVFVSLVWGFGCALFVLKMCSNC